MSAGETRFPPPVKGRVDILFVAGEHSGDQHAALIACELRQRHPEWQLAAMGGPSLQREGVQLLHDLTRDSVVGFVEVVKHYGTFKLLFEGLLAWVTEHRPQVVVLVDYPGFNLRFAEALARRGVSRKGGGDVAVYQYVSPQIWAWKAKRRFKMAGVLDELGVIFPFELDCYKDTDLPVEFVGHPFARESYRNPVSYDPEGPVLLLPGSRRQAVSRIFPVMLDSVVAYRKQGGQRRCVCLYPEDSIRFLLEEMLGRHHIDTGTVSLRSVETGSTAAAVLTSSGTMSLNCALAGIPGAIVYRAHPLTVWMGRRMIRVEWLGIANLVLGRTLYPEYIQEAARAAALAAYVTGLLNHPEARAPFAKGSGELLQILRAPSAATVPDRLDALVGE